MKLTKTKLRQIIKEELAEGYPDGPGQRTLAALDASAAQDALDELHQLYPKLIAQVDQGELLSALVAAAPDIPGTKYWTQWQVPLFKILEDLT